MSAGFTVLAYNDVEIYNCLTEKLHQEMVYDESGTDLLYTKYTIAVAGYLHDRSFGNGGGANQISTTGVSGWSGNDGNAALHYRNIRALLQEPRKELNYRLGCDIGATGFFGGTEIIHVDGDRVRDVNNGPRPLKVEISKIAANEIMHIRFKVEVCILECGVDNQGNNRNTRDILSNRWSCSDSIDNNWYTERTFEGTLVTTGLQENINPNSFRWWTFPPLQPGMERKGMRFSADADGKTLRYQITDQEVAWSAPAPATSWSMRHNESLGHSGVLHEGRCTVELGGDRRVDKKFLLAMALQICISRLVGAATFRIAKKAFQIVSMEFDDNYSNKPENTIQVSLHVKKMAGFVKATFTPHVMGSPISERDGIRGYNPNHSRGNRPDGMGSDSPFRPYGPIPIVGALSSFLQNPCSDNHWIENGWRVRGEERP